MSFYIYAETAFHHEGDKDYLIKLVDEAKNSGVNGIKFQVLINLNEFMSSRHSAYIDAEKTLLTFDEWREVFTYADSLGLDIIMMPLDTQAFKLTKLFNVKYIEIHSVSFKDEAIFLKLDECAIPLIFGVGGRTLQEIDNVASRYKGREIVLMVGFQSFPSQLEDIKIGRIKELSNIYPDCVIGYADHSAYDDEMGVTSNEYAYVLGARVFEKHIAINEGNERTDYQSAVGSEKLSTIISRLGYLDKILSIDKANLFEINGKEIVYRNRQKVPVARHDLERGHVLDLCDIDLRMINAENTIDDIEQLVGKTLKNEIQMGCAFLEKDLQ